MQIRTTLLYRLLALFTMVALLNLFGCGGGFKGDSPNAAEIQGPVFGGDSL